MSGSSNEAGKVLGASTVVLGGATLLTDTGLNILTTSLIAMSLMGVALVISSSVIKRIIIRK
jgi:hypothetical protein